MTPQGEPGPKESGRVAERDVALLTPQGPEKQSRGSVVWAASQITPDTVADSSDGHGPSPVLGDQESRHGCTGQVRRGTSCSESDHSWGHLSIHASWAGVGGAQ